MNAVLGTRMIGGEFVALGAEILKREREFNAKAGFTKTSDRLPEFMDTEELPPHNVVIELSDDVYDAVHRQA